MALKVLIVEDNSFLNKLFRIAFGHQKCETHAAFDGKDGWEQFVDFQPDIIVLDVVMPNVDGWELLIKLLEVPNRPFMAIVTNLDKGHLKDPSLLEREDLIYFKKSDSDPREITKKILDIYAQKKK